MEKLLLGLAAILLVGSLAYLNTEQQDTIPNDIQEQFTAFKQTYNKKYGGFEDSYRLQVYASNVQFAQNYNALKGQEVFGETLFFDLTDEEYAATYLTQLAPEEDLEVVEFTPRNAQRFDWREHGAVNAIKDQGQCGSCWAFSTVGAVEGHFAVANGKLPDLSEQQLVDCSGIMYGNLGCNGGMPSRALKYVEQKGLTTQDDYPYLAVQNKCAKQGGAFKTTKHVAVAATETGLVGALGTKPVSVAVDATNWKYYDPSKQAVFSDCGTQMNHAVLAVAYDLDQGFYTIRNSWTTKWGMSGYIQLKSGNTCGVLNAMVIPQ